MYHAVLEFGELTAVPAVGSTHKVTSDALQAVNILTSATGASLETLLCVLITAVDATVAVVVN